MRYQRKKTNLQLYFGLPDDGREEQQEQQEPQEPELD